MNNTPKIRQYHRCIVLCSGSGAADFLNSLVSCTLPEPGNACYGFLLNTAGRVQYDFFLYGYDSAHYLLDCDAEEADALAQELAVRSLGDAVKITRPKNLSIQTHSTQPEQTHGWLIADPRHASMGWREIVDTPPARPEPEYLIRRLSLGLPEGSADLPRRTALPLEYSLEALGAIDFSKGCFLGQEVCTRMFRQQGGKYTIRFLHTPHPLEADLVVTNAEGTKIGKILSTYPEYAFARLHKTHPRANPLFADGSALVAICEPWRK